MSENLQVPQINRDKQQFFFNCPCVPIEVRSSIDSVACYGKHTHEQFSLGIIESGEAEFFLSGAITTITPGSVVTINPNVVHSCNPLKSSWGYKMLYINSAWLLEVLMRHKSLTASDLYCSNIAHSRNNAAYKDTQLLFSQIMKGLDVSKIEYLLARIVGGLIQDSKKILPRQEFVRRSGKVQRTQDDLVMARDYIIEHCAESLTIAKIAEIIGLSQFHLMRSFKQRFGMTPHAFLIAQRVCRGRKLLASGMDISTAAVNAGFADQSHFHRNFKKMVAATPKHYKDGVI